MEPFDAWVEKFATKPLPKPPVTLRWPGRKLDPDELTKMEAIEFVCKPVDLQGKTDQNKKDRLLWNTCGWEVPAYTMFSSTCPETYPAPCLWSKIEMFLWVWDVELRTLKKIKRQRENIKNKLPDCPALVDWGYSLETNASSGYRHDFTLEVVDARVKYFHPCDWGSLLHSSADLSQR